MNIRYGDFTLADVADLSAVPKQLGINGKQTAIVESTPINAATMLFYAHGGRMVDVAVMVDHGFSSYEETAGFAFTRWNELPDQADLFFTAGTRSLVMRDAVLLGPEVVPGSIAEAACLIRWQWKGSKLVDADPDEAMTGTIKYEALAPSAAATKTATFYSSTREWRGRVTVGAGSGLYTYKIVLPTTGRSAGDQALLRVAMPASANPTIEIRNATAGGTTLATVAAVDDGAGGYPARTWSLQLLFNGTAWELWRRDDIS